MSKPVLALFLTLVALMCFLPAVAFPGEEGAPRKACKLTPVDASQVTFQDEFWAPRIDIVRKEGIIHQYRMLQETGRIENFRRAASGSGDFQGLWFNDSDVYKWVEAASRSLITTPDADLQGKVDEVVEAIRAAQQPDGYLNTFYQLKHPDKRWKCLHMGHELYCAGHLFQAAIPYSEATGKDTLIAVSRKFADLICNTFGQGKQRGAPGHECIEMGLVDLYRNTGEKKYLDMAEYFILERGKKPFIFEHEKNTDWLPVKMFDPEYYQAHKPFADQIDAVGHCVRALYLYAGATDVYMETGDETLLGALETLWESVYLRRMHITGGIGAVPGIEGFGEDYELPNEQTYNESCAQIASVMWNWRMLQLEGNHRYADAMERTLYNGFLSGISADGKHYFYPNPLLSHGQHERKEWFGCACCPPNLARALAGLGNLPYSTSEEGIWIHLYAAGTVKTEFADLEVQGRFPWGGRITITIHPKTDKPFALIVRKPNMCGESLTSVNGYEEELFGPGWGGYAKLEREWKDGDVVRLFFDMPVAMMRAHPLVKNDVGKVAVQKGPVIYCMEEADNPCLNHKIELYSLKKLPRIKEKYEADLLGGVLTLTLHGAHLDEMSWKGGLYAWEQDFNHEYKDTFIKFIPYFAWNNRGRGAMQVWIDQNP